MGWQMAPAELDGSLVKLQHLCTGCGAVNVIAEHALHKRGGDRHLVKAPVSLTGAAPAPCAAQEGHIAGS